MEFLKIIKRIASYVVFLVAATLFLLNSITVTLAPFIDITNAYEGSYMSFMYVILLLGVTLLFQILVIGKPKEIEETIYPLLLIVFFAVVLFVSVLVLGKSIVACTGEQENYVGYAIAGMTPTIILGCIEITIGAVFMVKSRKNTAKTAQNDKNGVNLTKEE